MKLLHNVNHDVRKKKEKKKMVIHAHRGNKRHDRHSEKQDEIDSKDSTPMAAAN
jgi:hypothetical protein